MFTVIIPVHNEQNNILSLLKRMPKNAEIIVVDDGSIDATGDVVSKTRCKLIKMKKNMGKTHACLEGLKHCKTKYCVFIDGDGQLFPEDIKNLTRKMKTADIVVGQRSSAEIPISRRLSNSFAARTINYITGLRFKDVLCGLRAVKKDKLQRINFRKKGYYFESEMLISAAKKGFTIKTVPVSVNYDGGSRMPAGAGFKIAGWLLCLAAKKFFGGTV